MAAQITKNNHYVPRFLTKPWELDQKKLRLYDFEQSAFETADSKTGFSATEPYPKEIETFLGNVVEKPIQEMRPLLLKGEDVLHQERYYRAAALLVALQRAKNRSTTDAAFLKVLIDLSQRSGEDLDAFGAEQGLGISVVRKQKGAGPLCFPSTGTFALLGEELVWKGKPVPVWGIPLELELALVSYPLGAADPATHDDLRRIVNEACPKLLERSSVGTSTAQKVAIAAEVKDPETDLASRLTAARQANMQAIVDHNKRVAAASKPASEQ